MPILGIDFLLLTDFVYSEPHCQDYGMTKLGLT